MKILTKSIIFFSLCALTLISCVTGNDDNAVLNEHEEALARTPRVLNLLVDGQQLTRDTQSNWEDIEVSAGDQLSISATFNTGNGATASTFYITRNYHHTSTAFEDVEGLDEAIAEGEPIDELAPLDGTAANSFGAGSTEYNFTYTVPSADDAGDAFVSGDHINISFWATNDTGGVGFIDFNLIFE